MSLSNTLTRLVPGARADTFATASEQTLLAEAKAGNARAFERLFERHAPAVQRFLRDLLRDASAADEGTQETFIRAHSKLRTLSEVSRLLPWLLGIARNVAHEARRARRLDCSLSDFVAEPEGEARLAQASPPVLTPEALLLGRETEALCARALALLSEDRRCALLLRLDHGLTYEEIALTMKWSLQKVKNEIHRARLLLRAELAAHLEVEE